ncbi:cilia- and flagella-associated protein 65 isoform X1 [Sarcophilus harrisii]|uniref:Cilia and flagella associated protein 65 n=1 Tax=Sarcophilus harrisii TaxID=9305 RepID=G3WNH6_SARHA|nr:cilia- and flagella-associated protein 65 isoform X1 [Sarcophilus harrisii]
MLTQVKSWALSPDSLQKRSDSFDCTINSSPTFSVTSRASATGSSSSTCAWISTSVSAQQPEQGLGTLRCIRKKQSKVKKAVFWGIQVAESLIWRNWILGKEIIKNLTLKNIHTKTQKLKYRLPSTKFFFTVYPQTIFLGPGMSFTLPIIFRPLEEKQYLDRLCFEMVEGEFSVELKAILPSHQLFCPPSLQLPLCAVSDTSEAWFNLCNVGDMPTFFTWDSPNPFHILPTTGLLEPGSVCQIKVVFQPLVALIYDIQASCWYGEAGEQKTVIQLQAVAKCCQLLVCINKDEPEEAELTSHKEVNFGPSPVGYTTKKCIQLINPSVVNAPFHIEVNRDLYEDDRVFTCPVARGVVSPGEQMWLSLLFRPQTVGLQSVDYLKILPPGNTSEVSLKLTGIGAGPAVSFNHDCVDFYWISLGKSATKFLTMQNAANCPAYFMFEIDNQESVFSLEPQSGLLGSMEKKLVTVTFQPTHPIIFYRRVACLIHHQEPLFLDIIGTCHSDSAKPAILRPRHLKWYRIHMARGLTLFSPDVLSIMLKEKKLVQDEDGTLMLRQEDPQKPPPIKYPDIPPFSEYFLDGTDDTAIFLPTISIEPRVVNFNRCSIFEEPNPFPLCLTNYTRGKITVVWTHQANSAFQVVPEVVDIPPLKKTTARLHFQPQYPNKVYAAELEAFAYYKVLRSYNNIEEDCTLFPSWCIRLKAMGHTYEVTREHNFPRYTLDVPKLFPAVSSKSTSYRTLLLCNSGSLMFTFNLMPNSSPDITFRPSTGFLLPGACQVFLLSTCPKGVPWKQHPLTLQFNFCPKYIKDIMMMSREEPLQLQLESGKTLYFKPTYVGGSSTSPFTIRNTTRLTLSFEWRYAYHNSKVVSVQPSKGIILPNEVMIHTWTFTPSCETKYLVRAVLWGWDARVSSGYSPSPTTHYLLRVIGEGIKGFITAKEKELDFGNVLVDSEQRKDLVLLNDGNCALPYRLFVEQTMKGPCDPEEVESDPIALKMDKMEGMLPARSQEAICLTARPTRRLQYIWTIRCSILTRDENKCGAKEVLCKVIMMGVYPTLSIVDVCATGSAGGITRQHLWKLLSLETLNNYLERDPTSWELTYKVPTRHSTNRIPSFFTPLRLDFNFGASPIGSEPSVVFLLLKNSGVVPLNWAFLFPSDQQIDLEFWAERTELDFAELHQMRVQDNQIFSITPKSGSLCPGQEQTVELTHSHVFVGTDHLPVLLKVSHGREILLNFIGVTVQVGEKYVHFTSTTHRFTPVAIGTALPSRQIYELYNGGSVPVLYDIQLDPLWEVQSKNFQHPIFQCLNPHGDIQPGKTTQVYWIFSPIEAKTYTVDVPINILGWNSAVVRFEGVGYDRFVMGDTAPFHTVTNNDQTPVDTKLVIPGQVVFLSQSQISLGNIPAHARCSRLIFLNNASEKEIVIFSWDLGSSNIIDNVILKVSPMMGVVAPGENVPFVVTMKASQNTCFYSFDLVCKIYLQRVLTQYEAELQAWEKEKNRQEVEFTITETNLEGLPEFLKSNSSCTACGRKYKTLPPIQKQPPYTPPVSWKLRSPKTRQIRLCPEAPKPCLLYLGLTARAHNLDDFESNFYTEFPCYFLHLPLKEKKSEGESMILEDKPERATLSRQAKRIVTDILTIVIRSLLEDRKFHEDVENALVEPIPYFSQFWSEESSRMPKKKSSLDRVSDNSTLCEGEEEGEDEGKDDETGDEEEESWEKGKLYESLDESISHQSIIQKRSLLPEGLNRILKEEKSWREKEAISRLPSFLSLRQSVLENMIQNIMIEASRGEVVLTTKPRVIALPPPPQPPANNLPSEQAPESIPRRRSFGNIATPLPPMQVFPKPSISEVVV